jgi:hypothetical protein
MSKEKNFEIALEEIQRAYDQLYNDSDTLDQKAKDLIAASGIIFTLFAGLQVTLVGYTKAPIYYVFLGVIFVFFLVTLTLLIRAIRPQEYGLPLKTSWSSIEKTILNFPRTSNAIEQLISNYIKEIKKNSKTNYQKAKLLNWAYISFAITMLVAVMFGFFVIG